jgi:methyltransferase (TIGR00027 family)
LKQVSRTAEYMALFRALETARPAGQRLFQDPFAVAFLAPRLHALAWAARLPWIGRRLERYIDARWPGARSSGVARTRLIDDWLDESLRDGARQVVLLGAGFDCRAHRMGSLATAAVFEVDQRGLLESKRAALARWAHSINPGVRYVPVDFRRDDLSRALSASRFDERRRTAFLWEGVTNYLDAAAVDAVLRCVKRMSASGGLLIFTYVHEDVILGKFTAPGIDALFHRLHESGESWTFGLRPEQLRSYLAERGLDLTDDLGAAEYRPLAMGRRADGQTGYEFYRIARCATGIDKAA